MMLPCLMIRFFVFFLFSSPVWALAPSSQLADVVTRGTRIEITKTLDGLVKDRTKRLDYAKALINDKKFLSGLLQRRAVLMQSSSYGVAETVVVGEGPVGLLTAIYSWMYGDSVTLVKKREKFTRNFMFRLPDGPEFRSIFQTIFSEDVWKAIEDYKESAWDLFDAYCADQNINDIAKSNIKAALLKMKIIDDEGRILNQNALDRMGAVDASGLSSENQTVAKAFLTDLQKSDADSLIQKRRQNISDPELAKYGERFSMIEIRDVEELLFMVVSRLAQDYPNKKDGGYGYFGVVEGECQGVDNGELIVSGRQKLKAGRVFLADGANSQMRRRIFGSDDAVLQATTNKGYALALTLPNIFSEKNLGPNVEPQVVSDGRLALQEKHPDLKHILSRMRVALGDVRPAFRLGSGEGLVWLERSLMSLRQSYQDLNQDRSIERDAKKDKLDSLDAALLRSDDHVAGYYKNNLSDVDDLKNLYTNVVAQMSQLYGASAWQEPKPATALFGARALGNLPKEVFDKWMDSLDYNSKDTSLSDFGSLFQAIEQHLSKDSYSKEERLLLHEIKIFAQCRYLQRQLWDLEGFIQGITEQIQKQDPSLENDLKQSSWKDKSLVQVYIDVVKAGVDFLEENLRNQGWDRPQLPISRMFSTRQSIYVGSEMPVTYVETLQDLRRSEYTEDIHPEDALQLSWPWMKEILKIHFPQDVIDSLQNAPFKDENGSVLGGFAVLNPQVQGARSWSKDQNGVSFYVVGDADLAPHFLTGAGATTGMLGANDLVRVVHQQDLQKAKDGYALRRSVRWSELTRRAQVIGLVDEPGREWSKQIPKPKAEPTFPTSKTLSSRTSSSIPSSVSDMDKKYFIAEIITMLPRDPLPEHKEAANTFAEGVWDQLDARIAAYVEIINNPAVNEAVRSILLRPNMALVCLGVRPYALMHKGDLDLSLMTSLKEVMKKINPEIHIDDSQGQDFIHVYQPSWVRVLMDNGAHFFQADAKTKATDITNFSIVGTQMAENQNPVDFGYLFGIDAANVKSYRDNIEERKTGHPISLQLVQKVWVFNPLQNIIARDMATGGLNDDIIWRNLFHDETANGRVKFFDSVFQKLNRAFQTQTSEEARTRWSDLRYFHEVYEPMFAIPVGRYSFVTNILARSLDILMREYLPLMSKKNIDESTSTVYRVAQENKEAQELFSKIGTFLKKIQTETITAEEKVVFVQEMRRLRAIVENEWVKTHRAILHQALNMMTTQNTQFATMLPLYSQEQRAELWRRLHLIVDRPLEEGVVTTLYQALRQLDINLQISNGTVPVEDIIPQVHMVVDVTVQQGLNTFSFGARVNALSAEQELRSFFVRFKDVPVQFEFSEDFKKVSVKQQTPSSTAAVDVMDRAA